MGQTETFRSGLSMVRFTFDSGHLLPDAARRKLPDSRMPILGNRLSREADRESAVPDRPHYTV
jgi:hypothetical protein